ncbi:hypothetical protein PRIC1_009124 [Phytophthora ramorum]
MLFLPLEEDSLLFRLCLYYGLLVLLLELLVPLLFQRRVRIEIPRLALRGPAVPLSTREFQQRRLALQQQLAALQRALAETPRRSPQKRRQLLSASAAKCRSAASPSPSSPPLASVKVSRPESSWRISETKQRIDRKLEKNDEEERRRRREDEVHREKAPRHSPMAMGDSLATRAARHGGFSFDEVIQEGGEMKSDAAQQETVGWEQAMNRRGGRQRESPTFSGRRPFQLVSEGVEGVGYSGPSEAASRLEALIGARRRQRASTSPTYVPPPPPPIETVRNPPARKSPPTRSSIAAVDKSVESSDTHASKLVQQDIPSPLGQREEDPIMDQDEETMGSEQRKPLTDFQAFCASFATGGSIAAQQAAAKRKHHEAFGLENEQTIGDTTAAQREKYKQPRVREDNDEQSDLTASPVATEPQRVKSPKHYEAFGSDDEQAIDEAFADQQVLQKRTHHQAFRTEKEERPHEKTPRIIRRISFTDEVNALAASPPKEAAAEQSSGKRKHQQAFGMIDEDDEDAEWRDSLAFRPHQFG